MTKLKWILAVLVVLSSGCSLKSVSVHSEKDVVVVSAHIQLKGKFNGQDPIKGF